MYNIYYPITLFGLADPLVLSMNGMLTQNCIVRLLQLKQAAGWLATARMSCGAFVANPSNRGGYCYLAT
jgi:hypothetical protein